MKGNFGSVADFSVAGAGAVQKWFRINGNGDGTAWALGINGESIMRNAKIHLYEKAEPTDNTDQGISYFNNVGTNKWTTAYGTGDDYDFYFNSALRAYISDVTGSYTQSSDRRLKKNIQAIGDVLDKVLQLKPSKYQYIDNGDNSKSSVGFVAQDVQKLFPEMVSKKGEYMGLSYAEFGVIAIKAIQEQQELIQNLKAEVGELHKRISSLK